MLQDENINDPESIIRGASSWLLALSLDSLGLKPRTINALRKKGFSFVKDVENFSSDALLSIPNFGRTSLHDLAENLKLAIRLGPASSQTIAANVNSAPSKLSQATVKLGSKYKDFDTLTSIIHAAISQLNPKVAEVIRARMGIGVEPPTLQEIGDELDLSRERVRQLEAKGASLIGCDSIWQDVLESKLSNLLDDRDDPLFFLDLSIRDDWFHGIEQMKEPFGFLLAHKNILNQRFSLLNANGQWFVSRLAQSEWDATAKKAMQLLEAGVGHGWSLSEARHQVDGLLDSKGRELRSELWSAARSYAHFTSPQHGKESTLVSCGQKLSSLIEAVLSDSECPLHCSNIAHRLADRYGKQIDVRSVHNEAADIAFLYGRGTYGLLKHCPLNLDEMALVREEVINIIFQGASDRQWSCAELFDILNEQGLDFDDRLNRHIINIALYDASELVSLGRFMWMQSSSAMLDATRRINIRQAVITLLKQAGKPMSNVEIKEALQRERGVSNNFQIQPAGSLIRVGAAMWGLIERDLALDATEQDQLVNVLLEVLLERNAGIHISEIMSTLDGVVEVIDRIKDPALIFALAQRSNLMQVSVGNYLYLSEWGEPRRLQKSEAITKAIQQSGERGLTTRELLISASSLLGREFPREGLYGGISAAGARFDEGRKRWVISNVVDDLVDT